MISVYVCSQGSVRVNCELAVNKAAAIQTLETIIEIVKEVTQNGLFGNFTVDPTSVTGENEFCNINKMI